MHDLHLTRFNIIHYASSPSIPCHTDLSTQELPIGIHTCEQTDTGVKVLDYYQVIDYIQ